MAKKETKVPKLQINSPVNATDIPLKARPARKGSMYDSVTDRMGTLKPGKGFTVPVPEGIDSKTFHNRVNAAIRRAQPQAPAGHRFSKRTGANGEVVLLCIPE